MKVKIGGFNYEGAHFRMIDSLTDERNFFVTLEGSEQAICDYILDQLSYGKDESITTVRQLANLYANGTIANADGCGGVWWIELDGQTLLDLREEFILTDEQREEQVKHIQELSKDLTDFPLPAHFDVSPVPIDLPEINLDEVQPDMNEYVAKALGIPSLRERWNKGEE